MPPPPAPSFAARDHCHACVYLSELAMPRGLIGEHDFSHATAKDARACVSTCSADVDLVGEISNLANSRPRCVLSRKQPLREAGPTSEMSSVVVGSSGS